MPVDQQDLELLGWLDRGYERVGGLALSMSTQAWQRSALALLESAQQEFAALVEREDIEEAQALEAMQQVRIARRRLDQLAAELFAMLELLHAERQVGRAPGQGGAQLGQFLASYAQGQLAQLRDAQALEVFQLALGFIHELPSSPMLQDVESRSNQAIAAYEQARKNVASEGAEAVDAYAELVDGRSLAAVCYLTARDLISAALRFDSRHEELDNVLPLLDLFETVGVKL